MTTPAWAADVCAGIHAAASRDVVYVPDNPLAEAGHYGDFLDGTCPRFHTMNVRVNSMTGVPV